VKHATKNDECRMKYAGTRPFNRRHASSFFILHYTGQAPSSPACPTHRSPA
jgi:hypothetical protein